ncbi:hypothetical protein BC830DRAFT_1233924 [Chytriomyces sp. MP71]|nr:hypothetical protein BC830DRAFT_1233924 [Chytriomyces sp. MP71]
MDETLYYDANRCHRFNRPDLDSDLEARAEAQTVASDSSNHESALTLMTLAAELIGQILSWIPPWELQQYRLLCHRANSLILDKALARLNVQQTIPLAGSYLSQTNTLLPLFLNGPDSYCIALLCVVFPNVSRMLLSRDFALRMPLSRGFPSHLTRLASLQYLCLSYCKMNSPIPPEIGQLRMLQELLLHNCGLSGPVPVELLSLTNLTRLFLGRNRLTGSIPDLFTLTRLQCISFHRNKLSGSIPPSIGNLKQLECLWLSNNALTGCIPESLGECTQLSTLDLSLNRLSGSIPQSLDNLVHLTDVFLSGNALCGSIPVRLEALTREEDGSWDYRRNVGLVGSPDLVLFGWQGVAELVSNKDSDTESEKGKEEAADFDDE